MYAQRNFLMYSGFLKKCADKKYSGIINHNRAMKNFIDTMGIVLLIVVKNIQNKLMKIATDMGCLIIL